MKPFSSWILLISLFLGSALADDPRWMVRIEKQLSNGGMISGTGYIVKIGHDYFIRTASHVTLGSSDGVKAFNWRNKALSIDLKGMIANNSADDQLFPLIGSDFVQLATYALPINQFVIEAPLSDELKKLRRIVSISTARHGPFYISPERIKREKSDELSNPYRRSSSNLDSIDDGNAKLNLSGESLSARVRVRPGESGSPVIDTTWKMGTLTDLNGKALNVRHDAGDLVNYISGHALSYHRLFNHSNFLAPSFSKKIVNDYLLGLRGDTSGVQWKYRFGVPYRSTTINGKLIEEANFGVNGSAGDGTSGNGGDGTSGNGGQSGPGQVPLLGMIYNSRPIYAFTVKGSSLPLTIYANWENYRFLEKLTARADSQMSYSAISFEKSLGELIIAKNDLDYFYRNDRYTGDCRIHREALGYGELNLYVKGLGYFKRKIGMDDLPNFKPIEKLTVKGQSFEVDYRGLWSVDASALHASENSFGAARFKKNATTAFLMMSGQDGNYSRLECAIVSGNVF